MNKLHESCWNALRQMKNVESPWGYNFSFSREKTWHPGNRFMIMTINPSSVDYLSSEKPRPQVEIRARTPWTDGEQCDFFAHEFPLSPYIRALFYELARQDGKEGETAEERYRIAADYAENNCPIAPFVPFRARKSEFLGKEMWKFAGDSIWPAIFDVWLPELIIVTGKQAYDHLCNMFPRHPGLPLKKCAEVKISDLQPELATPNHYRHSLFARDGKSVSVLGIPHPTAARYAKGLPRNFDTHSPEQGTPFRKFLDAVMADK